MEQAATLRDSAGRVRSRKGWTSRSACCAKPEKTFRACQLFRRTCRPNSRFDQRSSRPALCALIGEHLENLTFTLSQLRMALQPGGWLVFSVYHPDLAKAGKEANFQLGQTQYRLGAIRYTTADYLEMTWAAGFREIQTYEYEADQQLIDQIPSAAELLNQRIIFALRAQRPQ